MKRAAILFLAACGGEQHQQVTVTVKPAASAASSTRAEVAPDPSAERAAALAEARQLGMSGLLNIGAEQGASGGDTLGALPDGGHNARLPPEVIQRVVRQSFDRVKLCYQIGLRKDPSIGGKVSTKFVIDRTGAVSKAEPAADTSFPDKSVVDCVVKHFLTLKFPSPEGGDVTVIYPLIFAPGNP